jgi:hypothetical protein
MLRSVFSSALMLGVVLVTSSLVVADPITVPNASFESPGVANSPYYTGLPTNAEPATGDWGWSGYFAAVVYNNGNYTSVLTNADGNQFCAIDYSATRSTSVSQDLSAVFEAGKSYTLTVGIANRSDVPGNSGDQMDVRLFWRSLDGSAYGVLGTATATKSELSTTALKDYSVVVPTLQNGNAAIGNTIGIWLQTTTASASSSWSIDKVRLDAASVPEPCGLYLLANSAIGLLAYAWRKRR